MRSFYMVVLLLVGSIFGQDSSRCAGLPPSCESFERMRAGKDPNVTHALALPPTIVCFHDPTRDRFFTVSLDIPPSRSWQAEGGAKKTTGSFEALGDVNVQFFDKKALVAKLDFPNIWHARGHYDSSSVPVLSDFRLTADCKNLPSFMCSITINDSEILITQQIATIARKIKIKRSSMTFTDTFTEASGSETNEGKCQQFGKQ